MIPSEGSFPSGGAGAGGAGGAGARGSGSGYAAGIASAGDLVAGLFGYFAGENAQDIYQSRARMIQGEAEAEAQRYAEQADHFRATQKLAYLKSGVKLSGSPLDVLDETIRVGRENAATIRANGAARALDAQMGGEQAMMSGRNAFVAGVTGAAKTGLKWSDSIYKNQEDAKPKNNTVTNY